MNSPTSPYTMKDEPWSSHRFIVEWLLALKTGLIGLDVGAASGTIGEMCRSSGLILDGIEPHADWAALASPFYRTLYTRPVESIPDEKLRNYDFLVFGDVLEHLIDPQAVLTHLSELQSERCIFIISVPNIANLWIRINLMLGRFEYQERGILDRTHLRFFTWHSFQEMLQSAGLDVQEVRTTPIPLPQLHSFFRVNGIGRVAYKALYSLTSFFPRLLGYQFVVKATRHQEHIR